MSMTLDDKSESDNASDFSDSDDIDNNSHTTKQNSKNILVMHYG